jgi:hypothetical protein
LCLLVAGAWTGAGCASRTAVSQAEPNTVPAPVRIVCPNDVTAAEAIDTAGDVLTHMYFAIEKIDAEQGIVRTRPLRGGQFFELWRSDNASGFDCAEANVQTIRRTVELHVTREGAGQDPGAARLCLACAVSVQRLSLPEDPMAGTSRAYRIHLGRSSALRRIQVSPQQRQTMTWIDLGEDRHLAARILARIEQRLQRAD